MFLAIPVLAVSKVICDHVPELRPWGDILGDKTIPTHLSVKQGKVSVDKD